MGKIGYSKNSPLYLAKHSILMCFVHLFRIAHISFPSSGAQLKPCISISLAVGGGFRQLFGHFKIRYHD